MAPREKAFKRWNAGWQPKMDSPLLSLPVDCLNPIVSSLDALDIACLWFAGDKRLQSLLAHGGVTELEVCNEIAWPPLIRSFRLSSFKFSAVNRYHSPVCLVSRVDFTALPSTLTTLQLHFPNALSKLLLLPQGMTLGSLTPSLRNLSFTHQYVPTFERRKWTATLPNTLTNLVLPPNAAFDVDSILAIPAMLQSLTVTFGRVKDAEAQKFRSASAFDDLQVLHFLTEPHRDWLSMVPPSVTDLKWDPANQYVNRNAPLSDYEYDGDTGLGFKRASGAKLLKSLPPNLTSLSFPWNTADSSKLLKTLPSTILSLEDTSALTYSGMMEYKPEIDLALLPPQLTAFTSRAWNLNASLQDIMLLLPRNLAKFDLHKVLFPPTLDISRLPPLTTLHVAELHDSAASLLPVTLTCLSLSRNSYLSHVGLAEIAQRLTRLQELVMVFRSCPASFPLPLPASLRTLYFEASIMDTISPKANWTDAWPSQLRELTLTVNNGIDGLGRSFWYSLPPKLLSLSVTFFSLTDFPVDMSFLPRTLTSCAFSGDLNDPNNDAAPTLRDSFFEHIPPALTNLEVTGFKYKLTCNFFLKLPRRLQHLGLEHSYRSRFSHEAELKPLNSHHLVMTAQARTGSSVPSIWEALDLLPRLLTFMKYGHRPDFEGNLERRQLDDIMEACPNVAIENQTSGDGRSNLTTRRCTRG